MELGPVHRDEAGSPPCLHGVSRLVQKPPAFRASHSLADRAGRECEHGVGHVEWVERAQSVGPQPDAGAHFAELGSLLVYRNFDAVSLERDGRRKSADPAADDRDPGAHLGVRPSEIDDRAGDGSRDPFDSLDLAYDESSHLVD